ncbi:hypothetical protein ABK040_008645 [Willaertia magna]
MPTTATININNSKTKSQKSNSNNTLITTLIVLFAVTSLFFFLFNLIYFGPLQALNRNYYSKTQSATTASTKNYNNDYEHAAAIDSQQQINDEQQQGLLHTATHVENFQQFIQSAFINTIKYTKERTNDVLLPFPPNTKVTPKESFAYQFIDSLIAHTQVITCTESNGKFHSFYNGITNQLYGLAGCVASIGRL